MGQLTTENRKRIGIVGWKTGDNSIGITQPYYEFFDLFGDVEILAPNSRLRNLDLLVLPGGADVNPIRYNARPRLFTGSPNPVLEWFDVAMLPKYIEAGVPVFGICRGLQTLNVHFGGTLYQHRPHERSDSRDELVHAVDQFYNVNTHVFNSKIRTGTFRTNSLHHQSIKTLGKGLLATCLHKDGTPEAIMHENLPIHAVQYHPEEIYDDYSVKVIQHLLKSKKNNEQ